MNEIGELLLGGFIGYFTISITESISHNRLLHATRKSRMRWRKLWLLGEYINASWYCHHVVHHFRTFRRNHVTMFSSKLEESNLKEKMLNCGKEQVVLDSYGLRIGGAYRKFQYLYTHLVQLSIIGWFGGFWIAIGLMVTVVFYLWVAEYVHPYIHQSHQQALKCASPLMKVFIRSRYFRLLTKHHFLHHKYINCNFNLVLGGDFILGTHREPTKGDIAEMKSLGLFV